MAFRKALPHHGQKALFSTALKELADTVPPRSEPEVQAIKDRLNDPLGPRGIHEPVAGRRRGRVAQYKIEGSSFRGPRGDNLVGQVPRPYQDGSSPRLLSDGKIAHIDRHNQPGRPDPTRAVDRPGTGRSPEIKRPQSLPQNSVLPIDRFEFVDTSGGKSLGLGAAGKVILSSSSVFGHIDPSEGQLDGSHKRQYRLPVNRQSILRRPFPYRAYNITFILIGINLLIFFLSMLSANLTSYLAMNPVLTISRGFWWQPVTYMFVHSGISHLVFNMLGLFFFGTQVEREMGSYEFLFFYLLSGTLAGLFSLAVYWFSGSYYVFLLGASGAVFAVLLAFATYYPNAQIFIFGILPMRASVLVLVYTAIELFSQIRGGSNVAHLTHLAGFAFAYVYFVVRIGLNPIRRFFP